MADEMYLQKSSQYYAGNYVGAKSGLKKTIPPVIKANPETTVHY